MNCKPNLRSERSAASLAERITISVSQAAFLNFFHRELLKLEPRISIYHIIAACVTKTPQSGAGPRPCLAPTAHRKCESRRQYALVAPSYPLLTLQSAPMVENGRELSPKKKKEKARDHCEIGHMLKAFS